MLFLLWEVVVRGWDGACPAAISVDALGGSVLQVAVTIDIGLLQAISRCPGLAQSPL